MTEQDDAAMKARREAAFMGLRRLDEQIEDLKAVCESAAELMDEDAIGPWLDHESNILRGTPRELINRGEAGRVLAMLEALKDGVVF